MSNINRNFSADMKQKAPVPSLKGTGESETNIAAYSGLNIDELDSEVVMEEIDIFKVHPTFRVIK